MRFVRWTARILGLLMAGFLLMMFIGESLDSSPDWALMEPVALIGLVLMGLYAASMLLAIKRECAGASLGAASLGAFFVMLFLGLFPGNVSGGFSSQGVLNPLLLALWLPVLLHFLCCGFRKR